MSSCPFLDDLEIRQGDDMSISYSLFEALDLVTPFVANTPYRSGDYVSPSAAGDGRVFRVMTSGTPTGEPAWPSVIGQRITASGGGNFMLVASPRLIDLAGFTATFKVRDKPDGDTVYLTGTTGNGMIELGTDPPAWQATTAYVGDRCVVPTTPNGWIYRCDAAGTTGGTAPTWPVVLGQVVVDGTVTWRCVDDDGDVSNLRVALTSETTAALDDFGDAYWALVLTDAFGKDETEIEGNARLARDVAR